MRKIRFAASLALVVTGVGFGGAPACQKQTEDGTATTVAGLQTAELHVQGTDCASCEVSIRRHLRKLEGVHEIRPGADKQHVFVDFDPGKVTPEQIAKAVLEAGYDAEILVHARAT